MATTNTYSNEELQTFAKTVLSQMGGYNRINAMIGIKQLSVGEIDNNMQLSMKFKAKSINKANMVRITIESNDLYKVEFIRIWGNKITYPSTESGLYFDMLIEHFEQQTGLYLHL